MKKLLRWFWPERPNPYDRCARCDRLLPIAGMTDLGENDWCCRECR